MLLNKVLRSDTQLLLRVVSYRPNLSTDSTDSFRANKITSAASVRSLVVIIIIFFDPGTQFPRNEKITLCNTKSTKIKLEWTLLLLLLHIIIIIISRVLQSQL